MNFNDAYLRKFIKYFKIKKNDSVHCDSYFNSTTLRTRTSSSSFNDEEKNLILALIFMCPISILVNLFNVLVLTRPVMRSSSINIIFVAMELSNFVFVCHYLPMYVMKYYFPFTYYLQSSTAYAHVYLEIIQLASVCFTVWMTAVIAMWRCVGIVWPIKSNRLLNTKLALTVVIILSLLCLISITLDALIAFKIAKREITWCVDYPYGRIGATVTRFYQYNPNVHAFQRVTFAVFLVFFLTPTILSLTATSCLLWSLKIGIHRRKMLRGGPVQAQTKAARSIRSSVILIIMLLAFLGSNFVPYIKSLFAFFGVKVKLQFPWNYLCTQFGLVIFVNSLSALGFWSMSTKFRKTVRELFKCKTKCEDTLSTTTL